MNEPSKALPDEWIHRLFQRFQAIYGNRVLTMWGEANPDEVRQVWAERLAPFTGDDIRVAIEAMERHHRDYPPTLPQFTELCRDAKRRRESETLRITAPRTEMPAEVRAKLDAFRARHVVH